MTDNDNKTITERKYSIRWLLIFTLIFLITNILFFPNLLNAVSDFMLLTNFEKTIAAEVAAGIYKRNSVFMNWDWCLNIMRPGGFARCLVTTSWNVFLFCIMLAIYLSSHKAKEPERNSTRKMTDEEFDKLIPSYIFRKDEYNYPRDDIFKDQIEKKIQNIANNLKEESK